MLYRISLIYVVGSVFYRLRILGLMQFKFLQFSEEFNAGFGSHTPMVLGQAKVVRYFPNFER